MNKSQLVNLLCELNDGNLSEYVVDFEDLFKKKCDQIMKQLSCTFESIQETILSTTGHFGGENITYEWQYICLNFYILHLLNNELSKSDEEILTVYETKNVKSCLKTLITFGVLKNLQSNLPYYVKITTKHDIIYNYSILKCTICGFISLIKRLNLRLLILPQSLQGILIGIFQIAYCPLKKPSASPQNNFQMTEDTFRQFKQDQTDFKEHLANLQKAIHPGLWVREVMALFQAEAPLWLKKVLSKTLTAVISSKKGIEHITNAMLDGSEDDTTKTWKSLNVLTKLIMSCKKPFCTDIYNQLDDLIAIARTEKFPVYERLFVNCAKSAYNEDKELCTMLVTRIMTPLLRFGNEEEHKFRDGEDVTDNIQQTVRLMHGCFLDNAGLPVDLLESSINVMFRFYCLTVNSPLQATGKELGEVLIKYLLDSKRDIDELFDGFLFGFEVTGVPQFRRDLMLEVDTRIFAKMSNHTLVYATVESAHCLLKLLKTQQKIRLFGYLLKCITDKDKYFSTNVSVELLNSEENEINSILRRLVAIHELLSQLSEDSDVQSFIKTNPDDIIHYVRNVLLEPEKSDNSQFLFIILMIVENLVSNSPPCNLVRYKSLLQPLSKISKETASDEVKGTCDKIIMVINTEKNASGTFRKEETDFDKALTDICDPLLPVRGHGLMVLTKLVEKRDSQAMERKEYLLNIFQLSLKDDDSFIYLTAVRGLTALADVYPDSILVVLCEEYSDFTRKSEGVKTRMKIGEVLVKVTKSLGGIALKYKSLLLNTFLAGTKDDDHLMRASSLSNLGEVCQVLGYKLGTIVIEILACVHAVIATDKSVEARRAAVTVIKQLFVGLEAEMISFLKEDLLPIYRTLKEIYYYDKDAVMRLQAQLALEELNENMKSFIFPKPQLNLEKKIVMMD